MGIHKKTLLLFLLPALLFSSYDEEGWQLFRGSQGKSGPFDLYFTAEVRFHHHFSKAYLYRLTENIAYKKIEHVDFEFHYSYIYSKSQGATRALGRSRFEFEMNPHYTFSSKEELRVRNRLEVIKEQHSFPLHVIFREQWKLFFPLENCGELKGFSIVDEVFYSFTRKKWTQNRFIPLQANFRCGDRGLNLSLMIRNFFSSEKWYRSVAIVSELLF